MLLVNDEQFLLVAYEQQLCEEYVIIKAENGL